ncbi:glycosyltransferase family 9 protein [Candidatus Sumerlaeota bacterium]|nr:glycosyltransferase family 9 protein [Candidatus Sumerlaeota bacterium]
MLNEKGELQTCEGGTGISSESPASQSAIRNPQSEIPYRKIAVLRLGAMGDLLFTTPALRGLKARFSGSHLTYIALKKWKFLFRGSPTVDRFFGLAYRDPKALGSLRRESFDLLVNLDETEEGARIGQAIEARERRGHRWIDGRLAPDEHSAPLSREKSALMRLYCERISYPELYCRIAGVEIDDPGRYDLNPGRWAAWRADRFLRSRGLAGETRLVAVHTHSRGMASKTWPPEAVLEVVRALPETRFVVLGYRPDRAETRILESEANLVVSYDPIPVQAEILRRCALFVGIDSGPRQVAAAVGTRALCLFGPRPKETLPERAGDRALTVDADCAPCFEEKCPRETVCMRQIDPARILKEIRETIGDAADKWDK